MSLKLKFGILGAGKIAHTLANTVSKMRNIENYAIASRSAERAAAFASEHGIPHSYGDYKSFAENKEIDLIYIASTHNFHFEDAKLCLENGHHVLCEKAFTENRKQALELIRIAESKGVLISEAMWLRYMPFADKVQQLANSGIIGTLSLLTANLGYKLGDIERLIKPELAGGALLDVGVYVLNFAFLIFGYDIARVSSTCTKLQSGVDAQNSITVIYNDGRIAALQSSCLVNTDRNVNIYGSEGRIVIDNVNNPKFAQVINNDNKVLEIHEAPSQISGYEYEIESCIRVIEESRKSGNEFKKGQIIECPEMPHSETLRIMGMMDALRLEWGIKYPDE